MNQQIPKDIGPYEFRGQIGEGAFSTVKLAIHKKNKEFFACKIVPKSRVSEPSLKSRFELEIRINQQIHHNNIVQIIDLLQDDNNYYIFLEFCPNGELFQYIVDHKKLHEDEASILTRQIINCLIYIHSLGIVHRDIKPENLLLDSHNCIKLTDFGLSRFIGLNGLVETPCGSPCYASPECLSGKPYDGKKSDIWSLGVIVYAMVTGQLPWTKRNQTALFQQIKTGEYTIPTYLTDKCVSFISGLLTVDASRRLTLENALKHPWLRSRGEDKPVQCPLRIVSIKQVDNIFCQNFDEISSFISSLSKSLLHLNCQSEKQFMIKQLKKYLNNSDSTANKRPQSQKTIKVTQQEKIKSNDLKTHPLPRIPVVKKEGLPKIDAKRNNIRIEQSKIKPSFSHSSMKNCIIKVTPSSIRKNQEIKHSSKENPRSTQDNRHSSKEKKLNLHDITRPGPKRSSSARYA